MQVTDRPSPDAPSLTQAIIVQMVYYIIVETQQLQTDCFVIWDLRKPEGKGKREDKGEWGVKLWQKLKKSETPHWPGIEPGTPAKPGWWSATLATFRQYQYESPRCGDEYETAGPCGFMAIHCYIELELQCAIPCG